jgi:RNA polymerase sigma factor (sigma-70 family)
MADTKRALLERLFAEQGGALRAFFHRRVRRHVDVADLAQEVYLRLLRAPQLDTVRSPEAYLYAVASNLAKEYAMEEHRARDARSVEDLAVQDQLAELPNFPAEVDKDQSAKRLHKVLEQLPAKCHAAVVLRYWQGLGHSEIAQRLGISSNTVKKHLSRGLAHCRRRLAEQR